MSKRQDFAFAIGGTASGLASTVPSTLLLYFSHSVLGVQTGMVAAILLGPKLLSIVGDPLCGKLFDRLATRPASRAALLAGGAIAMIAGLMLVFAPPVLATPTATVGWLAGTYLFFCVGYSIYSVTHIAGPAVLASEAERRARIVSWRMTAVLIGVLIGAAGAPFIVAAAGGGRHGYALMAFITAATIALLMAGPVRVYERLPSSVSPKTDRSASLWAPFAISAFRRQAISFALLMSAVGAVTAATPFWVIARGGGTEADVGVLMGLLLLTSIACAPLWHLACRGWGERAAQRVMVSIYVVSAFLLAAAVSREAPGHALTAVYLLFGVAFSGLQVVPFTQLAHLTREATLAADAPIEGAITGCWTAMEKLGLAMGPAIAALLLGCSGGQPDLSFSLGVAAVVLLAGTAGWLIELMPADPIKAEVLS